MKNKENDKKNENDIEVVVGDESILNISEVGDMMNDLRPKDSVTNKKNIIIPKDRSITVNDTVYKVSVGATSYVKIIMVSNLVNAINYLKDHGYFIYAADMDGIDYHCISYNDKKVLVIGNEGKGISNVVKSSSDVVVKIPMKGQINSLNASVSAGILIYGMIKND